MRQAVFACAALILCSCAMHASEVGRLQEMGFRQITIRRTEDQKENPNYSLWVKDQASGVRKIQLCLVPRVPVAEYTWRVTVSVDGTARWSFSNTMYGRGRNNLPVDCATSAPLPGGRLSYGTWFQYKPHGASVAEEPKTTRDAPSTPLPPQSSPAATRGDPEMESRLRTLKELRERNLITEEQYQSSVKEVLQKLTQ